MGYIYKITNKINSKSYIGKTESTIEKRFQEHCQEAFKERSKERPLYRAMRKYGIDNFEISLIEETDDTEEREKYWIQKYGTYGSNGYNATLGGDGKAYYNHQMILEKLLINPYPSRVAKEIGCCPDIVREIAKINNISIHHAGQERLASKAKKILQYSCDGEYIQSFNSIAEASRYLVENQYTMANSLSSIRARICEAAKGKCKSAYGFVWRYA